MAHYYLNKNQQPNGDFEVHKDGCEHGANTENQIALGWFTDGVAAVAEAKRRFPSSAADINGCYYCSPESNTDR